MSQRLSESLCGAWRLTWSTSACRQSAVDTQLETLTVQVISRESTHYRGTDRNQDAHVALQPCAQCASRVVGSGYGLWTAQRTNRLLPGAPSQQEHSFSI